MIFLQSGKHPSVALRSSAHSLTLDVEWPAGLAWQAVKGTDAIGKNWSLLPHAINGVREVFYSISCFKFFERQKQNERVFHGFQGRDLGVFSLSPRSMISREKEKNTFQPLTSKRSEKHEKREKSLKTLFIA
jgi:hypothetical protein